MANTPTISNTHDAVKLIRDDHRHILALFQLYRASPADSRQSYVDQILQRLRPVAELGRGVVQIELRADDFAALGWTEAMLFQPPD